MNTDPVCSPHSFTRQHSVFLTLTLVFLPRVHLTMPAVSCEPPTSTWEIPFMHNTVIKSRIFSGAEELKAIFSATRIV